MHSSTIDNNIDVSIEVKIYPETSFRLRKGGLRHAFDTTNRCEALKKVMSLNYV